MPIRNHSTATLDTSAALLSSMCMIHCLSLPLVIAATPTLAGTLLSDEQFHQILLFFVLPISAVALASGYSAHRRRIVLASGSVGLILLLVASLAGHSVLGEGVERLVTVAGSALVVVGHVLNLRWMHQVLPSGPRT